MSCGLTIIVLINHNLPIIITIYNIFQYSTQYVYIYTDKYCSDLVLSINVTSRGFSLAQFGRYWVCHEYRLGRTSQNIPFGLEYQCYRSHRSAEYICSPLDGCFQKFSGTIHVKIIILFHSPFKIRP